MVVESRAGQLLAEGGASAFGVARLAGVLQVFDVGAEGPGADLIPLAVDQPGHQLGRIGENLAIGGGQVPSTLLESWLSPEMGGAALSRCPGLFWIAGQIGPVPPR